MKDFQSATIQRRFTSLPAAGVSIGSGQRGAAVVDGVLRMYAAVFDSRSEDLGGFREIIKPGAFARAIEQAQDVRALFNHDSNLILGRTSAGTLRLRETSHGLLYEIILADTQIGRDTAISVGRRDITGSSFAFRTRKDHWTSDSTGSIRELIDVDLIDVGPVTYPAYPGTNIDVGGSRAAMSRLRKLRIELALRGVS